MKTRDERQDENDERSLMNTKKYTFADLAGTGAVESVSFDTDKPPQLSNTVDVGTVTAIWAETASQKIPLSALVNVNVAAPPKSCAELLRETQGLLARISYKPGWMLTATAPSTEQDFRRPWTPWYLTVHLDYRMPSLDDPSRTTLLSTQYTVAERELERMLRDDGRDFIGHVVTALLKRAELHEMDEWLRLDGRCVVDPHPERSKA